MTNDSTRIVVAISVCVVILLAWARLVVDVERDVQMYGGALPSFSTLCDECKSMANVPACSFICNMNAVVNVPTPGLSTHSGVYLLKHHNILINPEQGQGGETFRWALVLDVANDGKVHGFSAVRRGSDYESYDVTGVYAGNSTLMLILLSVSTGQPAIVLDNTLDSLLEDLTTEDPDDPVTVLHTRDNRLLFSPNPGASGLKLTFDTNGHLYGATTGYTYLESRNAELPISVTFEKRERIPENYFSTPGAT